MYKPNMEDKRLKIKIINKSSITLHGLRAGKSVDAEADENGTPLDKHWRRRLRDSEIDGCIEIVKEQKKEVKKITKEGKD